MKARTYIFIYLSGIIFFSCKNNSSRIILSGNISQDVTKLLTAGDLEIQIMDSLVQTPRESALADRMQKAVEHNSEWYSEWAAHYHQLQVLPYHPNFGLNESEYNELMEMKLNKTLASSATYKIKILNMENHLQLNTGGSIPYLDNLKFNTKDNTVSMDNYTLHFTDTLFIANENHGLKSMWKGYVWRYDEPAINDTANDGLNTKHYSITLGQLYKTGNTLLIFSKLEDTDGERTLNLEKAFILKKD